MDFETEKKIMAPIVWDSKPKFKIQDLRENHYEEVIRLVKHHYFREESMCRSIGLLRDFISTNAYLDLIRTWMRDTCGLVAVSQKSGRVVGVIIMRFNSFPERTNTYSRVQIFEGQALESIMLLKSALIRQANAYKTLGHDTYLRVYLLCIHPSYKRRDVGYSLLESCCLVALNMKVPVIAGVFTTSEHQSLADRVGFSMLTEIYYNNWLIDNEVVFDDPGIGNYSAAFMTMVTPDEKTFWLRKRQKEKEDDILKGAKQNGKEKVECV